MGTIGSAGGLMVWGSQCLAYLRWWYWLRHHHQEGQLPEDSRYNRWVIGHDRSYASRLSSSQPLPALIGLTCCFLAVLVFSSATWWNHEIDVRKVCSAYAGVSLVLRIKAINGY